MRFVPSCIIALSALLCVTLVSAADFTAAEREKIAGLRNDIETGCKRDVTERLGAAAQGAPVPAASRWLNDVANSPEYCGCTAQAFTDGLTPQMLNGSEIEARRLMRRSAVQCLLPKLKTSFPATCRLMVTEPLADGSAPPKVVENVDAFCGCVQPAIEAVTVDNYDAFMRATMEDYAEYRKSGKLEAVTPGSLLLSMQLCGLAPPPK